MLINNQDKTTKKVDKHLNGAIGFLLTNPNIILLFIKIE